MRLMFRACPDCGGARAFELFHATAGSCPDSPDGRCPEWACTECGAALIEGMLPEPRALAPARDIPSKVA